MIELLTWAFRWMALVGVLFCAGHVIVAQVHGITAPRMGPVVIAVVGALGGFLSQAMTLTGTVSGAFDQTMLGLLWSTVQGTALSLHLSGALIVVIGLALRRLTLELIGALVMLSGFLVVGHVADIQSVLLVALLALHLLLAAYWLGILWPLYRLAGRNETAAAELGARFGRNAMVAVPVLLGLGGVIALSLLERPAQLWATPYGRLLVAKIGCVGLMLALGAANKTRHVPALQARRPDAGRRFQISLLLETGAALAVLGATAAFTTWAGLP